MPVRPLWIHPFLLLVLFGGCTTLIPPAEPDPAIRPIPLRNQSTIAIARFQGRNADEVERHVRQAVEERSRFLLIDAERAHRLADAVRRGRSGRDETYGVEIVIYGEVAEHDVAETENAAGANEYVALVEVYFEVVDLRTGEVRGARRVRRTRKEGTSVVRSINALRGEGRRRSSSERRQVQADLLREAREAVARDFSRALTRR